MVCTIVFGVHTDNVRKRRNLSGRIEGPANKRKRMTEKLSYDV